MTSEKRLELWEGGERKKKERRRKRRKRKREDHEEGSRIKQIGHRRAANCLEK